jgi:hypothetical protein
VNAKWCGLKPRSISCAQLTDCTNFYHSIKIFQNINLCHTPYRFWDSN